MSFPDDYNRPPNRLPMRPLSGACPHCLHRLRQEGWLSVGLDHTSAPEPGDYVICRGCCDVLRFTERGYSTLTDADIESLRNNQEAFTQIMYAQRNLLAFHANQPYGYRRRN